MSERVTAEGFPIGSKADLSCGCVAIALAYAADGVLFGIERTGQRCLAHADGDTVPVGNAELVLPFPPSSIWQVGD